MSVLNAVREDYLITIYRLTKTEGYTNSVTLARTLGVSRASVSEMVKKLLAEELIIFSDNRLRLSVVGKEKAKALISAHRLWEIFLTEHLNLSIPEAHEQAHLLEHVTSEELREALNEFLGFPPRCPGGQIIWDNVTSE